MELSADDGSLEGGARASCGMLGRTQAKPDDASDHTYVRGAFRRGWAPAGRAECNHWQEGHRPGDSRTSGRSNGKYYWLHRSRPAGNGDSCQDRQACPS